MKTRTKIALTAALLMLAGINSTAWARASSNIGHGMTCYTYPVTNANGTVTYQRICHKRP